ncbi:MAG: hypothetical protein LAT56_12865 [Wenzhouxiangella sp.]|nr:hypothetical protein [Wenzhouxiangella sp.]
MALIKPGALIAEIRGSVGGATFARNRGGQYVRNRSIPLNPQSTRQVAVRQQFGNLSNLWSTTLTPTQRTAWSTYAANVPLPNALGEDRNVSGINMFSRGNALLQDTGGTLALDGPEVFTQGPSFTPTITIDAGDDELTVVDLGGYDPAASGVVGLLIAQSLPQQPGVNFYKSPFRKVSGTTIATLAGVPEDVPLAFPVAAGQAVFIRTAVVTADGRVGVPVIQRFLVA